MEYSWEISLLVMKIRQLKKNPTTKTSHFLICELTLYMKTVMILFEFN